MTNNKKKKSNTGRVFTTIFLVVALAVFCYSAYQLLTTVLNYHASNAEYSELEDDFAHPIPEDQQSLRTDIPPELQGELVEEAAVPLEIDFDELEAINPDVKGWLYVEGIPSISYPILLGEDNDFYLHHTFRKEALFAGSVFMDYQNSGNFSDPTTIVYGHNMKNGSMFGMLKDMRDPEVYEANPYFWILTKDHAYRYHIYSVMSTDYMGETYTLFSGPGPGLLQWEQKMQSLSEVPNKVFLSENDHSVILSTCTSNSTVRLVVIGKCVSIDRPPVRPNIPYPEPKEDDDEQNQPDSEQDSVPGSGTDQGVSAYR
ncbi:MAG: class B sortase [Lachnospiraceae bacterium]|nr:class B sortase [Candidatus Equihabitans merdae]